MATSDYDIYHSLNTWREIMQDDIWRFNQVLGTGVRTLPQKAYNQFQRDEIAQALTPAFDNIADIMQWFPKPTYYIDEDIHFRSGHPYWLQNLNLSYLNLIALGERATSLIEAGATVVYSDADGDGIDDTATVTVISGVATDEVQLFFQVADGALDAASEFYRIEPVRVSASGGTITITGHRALFVKPSEWAIPFDPADPNSLEPHTVNPTLTTGFVTAVDVYRVYTDATSAITLIADPTYTESEGSWGANKEYAGQGYIMDKGASIIRARQNSSCPYMVHKARVKYLSGEPLQNGKMNMDLARAMTFLANTYFPKNLECPMLDRTQTIFQYNRDVIAEGVAPSLANNPFGVLRGQVDAWKTVMRKLRKANQAY